MPSLFDRVPRLFRLDLQFAYWLLRKLKPYLFTILTLFTILLLVVDLLKDVIKAVVIAAVEAASFSSISLVIVVVLLEGLIWAAFQHLRGRTPSLEGQRGERSNINLRVISRESSHEDTSRTPEGPLRNFNPLNWNISAIVSTALTPRADTSKSLMQADDQTSKADDQTTQADDQTTKADDQTTKADEQTIKSDYRTIKADDQTTKAEVYIQQTKSVLSSASTWRSNNFKLSWQKSTNDEGQQGLQPVTEDSKATNLSDRHQSSKWFSNFSTDFTWYKDTTESLMQKANKFKLEKKWSEAGDAFSEAAEKFSQRGGSTIYEQADCYQSAANCFCKTDKPKAVHCFERAAQLYCEVGQFSIAARLMETAGELTEELARKFPAWNTQNSSDPELSSFEFVSDANSMQEAINRYQKAAEHFSAENSVASAASCRTKLAILLGDSGQFRDAANEFAKLGEEAQGHGLLQFGANDHMLKSCLCQLAMDLKACSKRADELAAKSESFARSDEFALVKGLAAAISVEAFDKAVAEYQRFKFPKKLDEFDMRRITDARKSVQSSTVELS